jgi:uncharacterized protein (TIGR03083 family)
MGRRSAEERSACLRMVVQARRELGTTLEDLTQEQWRASSLCEGWTVRDVAAHLAGWDDLLLYRSRRGHAAALWRFVALYATSFGSMRRLNAQLHRRTAELDGTALARRFGSDDDTDLAWLFDGTNPEAHLAEYVVHLHDIRGPLGLEERIDPEVTVAALRGLLQLPSVRLPAWWRLRKQRLEATDADWARGRGEVTRMPAADILYVLAGRT